MNYLFVWMIILCGVLFASCSGRCLEPKYAEHQTYSEYLVFLGEKTKNMHTVYEKTTYIRRKTAELVDGGLGLNDVRFFDKNWTTWSGEEYYDFFRGNMGTVYCGGASYFLRNVYKDMEYETIIYNMNYSQYMGHQITLVWDEQEDGYLMQDAYLNTSYGKGGSPLVLGELLMLLKDSGHSEIEVLQGKYDYPPTWDTLGRKEWLDFLANVSGVGQEVAFLIYEAEKKRYVPQSCQGKQFLTYGRNYKDVLYDWLLVKKYFPEFYDINGTWLYLFMFPDKDSKIYANEILDNHQIQP